VSNIKSDVIWHLVWIIPFLEIISTPTSQSWPLRWERWNLYEPDHKVRDNLVTLSWHGWCPRLHICRSEIILSPDANSVQKTCWRILTLIQSCTYALFVFDGRNVAKDTENASFLWGVTVRTDVVSVGSAACNVGSRVTSIQDRFQGHCYSIASTKQNVDTTVGRHFRLPDHRGLMDVEIQHLLV
jgi:hypothetical protein